ncbi:hypothetical protein BG004_004186 [Podila humilis]|nr:hypothetical protein BG004_004186 [Podila humilis]
MSDKPPPTVALANGNENGNGTGNGTGNGSNGSGSGSSNRASSAPPAPAPAIAIAIAIDTTDTTDTTDTAVQQPLAEELSPILVSDPEFDSQNEQNPPTRSPSLSPLDATARATHASLPSHHAMRPSMHELPPTGAQFPVQSQQHFGHGQGHGQQDQHGQPGQMHAPASHSERVLHVPAPLRRNNSSFVPFSEIPTLPTFLNNCNLSQYLQSFNDAGANDDVMPMIIDFDEEELKTILDAVPMLPFHVLTFKRGIRDLRERSRLGSMHFDNSQSSFMHPEPHATLQVSHSQFFQTTQFSQHSQQQQQSQPSQSSHHSQTMHSPRLARRSSHQQQHQQPGLYRQQSVSRAGNRPSSQSHMPYPPALVPTPTQVLSGMYQDSNNMTRLQTLNQQQQLQQQQQYLVPSQEPAPASKTSVSHERRPSVKRRRSYTASPPDESEHASSSPVLPEPSSFNSNTSSSWGQSQGQSDQAARDVIMQQAMIYGKHTSRPLTKYEAAINRAAQILALEDPHLLTNKQTLWNLAKAKLLREEYDYKRGRSRSKLPEASQKTSTPTKASREKLIQRREANASNTANARLKKIASLNEELHRKTSEREDILSNLLRVESPENRKLNPSTYEAEAKSARDRLAILEAERNLISKELGSLRNKERKHQWYERRKKVKGDAGTDADADEEGGGGGTDTTMDPDGEMSSRPDPRSTSATPTTEAIVTSSRKSGPTGTKPSAVTAAVAAPSSTSESSTATFAALSSAGKQQGESKDLKWKMEQPKKFEGKAAQRPKANTETKAVGISESSSIPNTRRRKDIVFMKSDVAATTS